MTSYNPYIHSELFWSGHSEQSPDAFETGLDI